MVLIGLLTLSSVVGLMSLKSLEGNKKENFLKSFATYYNMHINCLSIVICIMFAVCVLIWLVFPLSPSTIDCSSIENSLLRDRCFLEMLPGLTEPDHMGQTCKQIQDTDLKLSCYKTITPFCDQIKNVTLKDYCYLYSTFTLSQANTSLAISTCQTINSSYLQGDCFNKIVSRKMLNLTDFTEMELSEAIALCDKIKREVLHLKFRCFDLITNAVAHENISLALWVCNKTSVYIPELFESCREYAYSTGGITQIANINLTKATDICSAMKRSDYKIDCYSLILPLLVEANSEKAPTICREIQNTSYSIPWACTQLG